MSKPAIDLSFWRRPQDADHAYHSVVANLAKWGYWPPKAQLVSHARLKIHEFAAAGQGIVFLTGIGHKILTSVE